MTRPSQPSQEDVKKAKEIAHTFCDRIGFHKEQFATDGLISLIATAIMQARRETVEKCADIPMRVTMGKDDEGDIVEFASEVELEIRALLDEEAK